MADKAAVPRSMGLGQVLREGFGRQAIMVLAALMGGVALLWFGANAVGAHKAARDASATALEVTELRGRIAHLDEVLTMSVRLAAATGQGVWVTRYEEAGPRLEETIAEALRLSPLPIAEHLRGTTDAAKRRRVEIERDALRLVAAELREDATALLDGPEYQHLSRVYLDGLQIFVGQLEEVAASGAAAIERRAWIGTGALGVTAALLAVLALTLNSRSRLQAALRRTELAAETDPLTCLANRRGFSERLDAALKDMRAANARGQVVSVAVMLVDLDRFKAVNDAYGHDAGDRLLVEVAGRLRAALRPGDVLARLGGDEFAAVVTVTAAADARPEAGTAAVVELGRRMVAAVCEPVEVAPGITAGVGASVGLAIAPADGTTASALLRAADLAVYRAKAEGRGRVSRFEPVFEARARARAELEAELRMALMAGAIQPYFQPIVPLNGERRVVAFELLARWTGPGRGPLPAGEFIRLAEEIGVIGSLSMQLLRQGCRILAALPPDIALWVNVPASQLRDRDFPAAFAAVLCEEGIDPRRLQVEVNETAVIGDLDLARAVLGELSGTGVRVALDDFGTSYSSLRHLKALPIDCLKIDASFVRGMLVDGESRKIVAAILGLGGSLGLPTIAEGVEDEATCALLREMGCDLAQGWFFGRPVPPDGLQDFLTRTPAAEG